MTADIKTARRVARFIAEVQRDLFTGIGNPEALKGDLPASWCRWIDDEHRLVDRADDSEVKILKALLSVLTHRTPPAPLTP